MNTPLSRSLLPMLSVLFCACAAPHATTIAERAVDGADEELAGEGLALAARLFLVTDRGERAVAPNETLHSGDRVYLSLRASQRAFAYAVHLAPDGGASVLFPQGEAQLVEPGCALRIPQRGTLYLQDPPGLENLHVVASLRPLPQADRRLCDQLRLPCAKLAALPPPLPRPCASARGQVKTRGVLSAVTVGRAAGNGVAAVKLPFRHDP